ncbi:MAG: hypothetical protein HZB16_13225 [Armatimonadetes bacterium]|nr:hypothetical protein [Armatimonadota bacterium]
MRLHHLLVPIAAIAGVSPAVHADDNWAQSVVQWIAGEQGLSVVPVPGTLRPTASADSPAVAPLERLPGSWQQVGSVRAFVPYGDQDAVTAEMAQRGLERTARLRALVDVLGEDSWRAFRRGAPFPLALLTPEQRVCVDSLLAVSGSVQPTAPAGSGAQTADLVSALRLVVRPVIRFERFGRLFGQADLIAEVWSSDGYDLSRRCTRDAEGCFVPVAYAGRWARGKYGEAPDLHTDANVPPVVLGEVDSALAAKRLSVPAARIVTVAEMSDSLKQCCGWDVVVAPSIRQLRVALGPGEYPCNELAAAVSAALAIDCRTFDRLLYFVSPNTLLPASSAPAPQLSKPGAAALRRVGASADYAGLVVPMAWHREGRCVRFAELVPPLSAFAESVWYATRHPEAARDEVLFSVGGPRQTVDSWYSLCAPRSAGATALLRRELAGSTLQFRLAYTFGVADYAALPQAADATNRPPAGLAWEQQRVRWLASWTDEGGPTP